MIDEEFADKSRAIDGSSCGFAGIFVAQTRIITRRGLAISATQEQEGGNRGFRVERGYKVIYNYMYLVVGIWPALPTQPIPAS